jgi:hypothetical protein
MSKIYKSMRGKEVDLEKLTLKNEGLPAVGNAKMNARGDMIGPGGKVLKSREEILAEYYASNPRAIQEEVASRKK